MSNSGVVIVQQQNIIKAVSQFPILPQYQNFSFTAESDGQTEFPLANSPVLTGVMSVFINGVAQDPLNGDYTVAIDVLVIGAPGLDEGDRVFGFYQIMSPAANNPDLNFESFFIEAIQDQSVFTLDFSPSPLIYVAINGVIQAPTSYTVDGYDITFDEGLDLDDKVYGVGINNN